MAERHGKTVKLLVVPSTNVFDAVAQTAVRLHASEIVVGESAKLTWTDQARLIGDAWERASQDRRLATALIVVSPDGRAQRFSLGAHAPDLRSEDIEQIHRLWVEAVKKAGPDVHHRDIVTAALATFEEELHRDAPHAMARLRAR